MENQRVSSASSQGYEAPKVVELGSIGSTLQGNARGSTLDGGLTMVGTRFFGTTTLP